MRYYILPNGVIIPQEDDFNEPESWVFEVHPLPDKVPPEIHISRPVNSYKTGTATEIINTLRESKTQIGDISQKVIEKGVLPAMERLVLMPYIRREIIMPELIGG